MAGLLGQVHEFTIRHVSSASVNPEGRTVETLTESVVRGHLALAGEGEIETGGRFAQQIDLVARLASDVSVDPKDRIVSTVPLFEGTFEIAAMRPTARHLRLLLRRTSFGVD